MTSIAACAVVLFFCATVSAQEPEQKQPEQNKEEQKAKETDPYSPYNNPTVTAITSKYTFSKKPEALTTEKMFPVIGNYEITEENNSGNIHITLDPEVKGIVWVDGLPQGKIKAMLRQSPATYKIPAQKSDLDKEVPEGTLMYDEDTKTLSICLGLPYNNEDPSSAFLMPAEEETSDASTKNNKTSKTKKEVKQKPVIIVAMKLEAETVSLN